MKRLITLIVFVFSFVNSYSQLNLSIHEIQFKSVAELTLCNDSSQYIGDTVLIQGIVLHDGNLTEIPSSSVVEGYRSVINIRDTANAGLGGDFSSIQIHGVFFDSLSYQHPIPTINTLVAGDIVEVIGVVGSYNRETMIFPLNTNSVTKIGTTSIPAPVLVNLQDLNDTNKINQLVTGEKFEGEYVKVKNVTVSKVSYFNNGGQRVYLEVVDQNGNVFNVMDRFITQKLSNYSSVNPLSPQTNGEFIEPVVGTFYGSISGIIGHSGNGCAQGSNGGSAFGYVINPFDSSHYSLDIETSINEHTLVPNEVTLHPFVYPNPYRIRSNSTHAEGQITFTNLPQNCIIRIYGYSGNLVDEISTSSSEKNGLYVLNLNKYLFTNGTFIYSIEDLNQNKISTGKFLIIK